jgi:hypothetical protein
MAIFSSFDLSQPPARRQILAMQQTPGRFFPPRRRFICALDSYAKFAELPEFLA